MYSFISVILSPTILAINPKAVRVLDFYFVIWLVKGSGAAYRCVLALRLHFFGYVLPVLNLVHYQNLYYIVCEHLLITNITILVTLENSENHLESYTKF